MVCLHVSINTFVTTILNSLDYIHSTEKSRISADKNIYCSVQHPFSSCYRRSFGPVPGFHLEKDVAYLTGDGPYLNSEISRKYVVFFAGCSDLPSPQLFVGDVE
jgi:hypothetical protein